MEMQDFPFCFEHSYETDDSKHFSDEIVENDFAYFIVESYEHSCRNVKEVLKRREWKRVLATVYFLVLAFLYQVNTVIVLFGIRSVLVNTKYAKSFSTTI